MRFNASLCLTTALLGIACRGEPREKSADAAVAVRIDSMPSPAAVGSTEPNLFADDRGRVYMSWLEPAADSAHALRFAVLEGTRWSAPRTIAQGREFWLNWADFPSLVRLPDGRLAAHWLARSGAGTYDYDVRIAQSLDDGATWSEPVIPYRERTRGEHGFVALFPAAGDSLGAVWLDGRGYDTTRATTATKQMMLASVTLDRGGAMGAERVVDARTCDCCQTAAAVTSRGPLVVYRDRDANEIRDIYASRLEGGRWTQPRAVHDDRWRVDYCPVNGPSLSARGERVAVAWFTAEGERPRVQLAFSDDAGTTWGAPIQVDDGQPAGRVDVELTEDGGAWVSWLERTGGESAEVRLRRVAGDGGRGASSVVSASSAARASGFPRLARDADGVVLAWTIAGKPSRVRVARVALEERP